VKVSVTDIRFLAFFGVTSAEREIGHRVRLDLTAEVSETASSSDRIEDTVDYAALAARAVELCLESPCHTVEFACSRVGKGLLKEFPRVFSIIVRLQKMEPLLSLSVQAVGVEETFVRVA
jgi:dihydroneopterin aldolase